MENLPKDPFILFSYINTKLRDEYSSLEKLCDDMNIDKEEITRQLQAAGFEYNQELNKFQ